MVDLRTDSERIVRELKRGERMVLSYRGEPLAELVPTHSAAVRISPHQALAEAEALTSQNPQYAAESREYLRQLREDEKAWGDRTP